MTTTLPRFLSTPQGWSNQALAIASQAKVLSGNKLEQLVVRLQRHTGKSKDACWRFIIQYGLKSSVEHRRWTEAELDLLREDLVKSSVEEVARKLNRSPKAVRSYLMRNQLRIRDIRSDQFSVESLSAALHVSRSEILKWIEQGWLPSTNEEKNGRNFHVITPEGLESLYKHHHKDLLRSGRSNLLLFEAYVQYCHSPKHTTGSHLLDVRRDKREREAFADTQEGDVHDEDDFPDEGRYGLVL